MHTQGEVEIYTMKDESGYAFNVFGFNGKKQIAGMVAMESCAHEDFLPKEERAENAKRFRALWNTSNDMTTEEAVRYLEHGPEMECVLREVLQILFRDTACPDAHSKIWQLLGKMELEGK
jgi:hypothetical protein